MAPAGITRFSVHPHVNHLHSFTLGHVSERINYDRTQGKPEPRVGKFAMAGRHKIHTCPREMAWATVNMWIIHVHSVSALTQYVAKQCGRTTNRQVCSCLEGFAV